MGEMITVGMLNDVDISQLYHLAVLSGSAAWMKSNDLCSYLGVRVNPAVAAEPRPLHAREEITTPQLSNALS